MCVEAITFVWTTSKAAKTELLMLLALADWANELGECWPGIKAIAEKARMTERNAQILLRKLASTGAIIIEENAGVETRTGNTNRYTIVGFVEWFKEVKGISSLKSEGVKNSASRGEKSGTKGVKGISPKPSDKPLDKPLEESSASASQNETPKSETQNPPLENEKSKIENDNSNPKLQEKALEPLTPSSAPPPTPLPLLAPPGRRWIFRSDNTRHLVNANAKQPQRTACHQEAGSHAILVGNPLDYVECAECKSIAYRSETFSDEIKNALATLCKRDWRIKTHQKHMNDALSQIVATGPVTIELLRRFYVNWRKCDFRGQKGQFPSPAQVVEKWTEYTESDDCREETFNGATTTQQSASASSAAPAAPDNGREPSVLGQRSQVISKAEWGRYSEQSKRNRG